MKIIIILALLSGCIKFEEEWAACKDVCVDHGGAYAITHDTKDMRCFCKDAVQFRMKWEEETDEDS